MIIHKTQSRHKYDKEHHSAFLDFGDCGLIHAPKNWRHKKRFLEKYELIYVLEGALYLKIDEYNVTLSDNDLIIIPPYKTVDGSKESSQQTSFFWVNFLTDDPDHFGLTFNLVHIKQPEKFIIVLEELINLSHHNKTADFTMDATLILLLSLINKSIEESSSQHLIINKVINYVESNISEPLTVEMVADALKYNKDYISRIVKNYYGISLKKYIDLQKLNLAKRLLTTSNYSIKDISLMLGFNESNLFTKFFKYHEKISPLEYRKKR